MSSNSVFSTYRQQSYPFTFKGTLHVGTLMGGIPSNDEVAAAWLKNKVTTDDTQIQAMVAEVMLERKVGMEDALKIVNDLRHLNGFKSDERGLYIEGRQLKASLKEGASIAVAAGKIEQRGWGDTRKFLTTFLPEHLFVVERRLYVGRTKADGIEQKFVHTHYGNAIAYSEYVTEVDIDFTVVTDWDFSDTDWAIIWTTCEQNGLGAARSQGYGTFEVTRWDKSVDPSFAKRQAAKKAAAAKKASA